MRTGECLTARGGRQQLHGVQSNSTRRSNVPLSLSRIPALQHAAVGRGPVRTLSLSLSGGRSSPKNRQHFVLPFGNQEGRRNAGNGTLPIPSFMVETGKPNTSACGAVDPSALFQPAGGSSVALRCAGYLLGFMESTRNRYDLRSICSDLRSIYTSSGLAGDPRQAIG